jgi:riboflavin kinase/FMN adenylyltransferase
LPPHSAMAHLPILHDWHDVPADLRGASVALGNFDGVHLGHALLLRAAHAARPDAPLAVLTFEPHPREVFRPDDAPFRLTLPAERADLLAGLGVQIIYELRFDRDFAALTADRFLADVLGAGFGVRHVCCGPDFAFGHRRGGDVALLARWSETAGVGLTVVPPLSDGQGQISSTRIRRLLQDGYPERAAAELGRSWSLRGIVQQGDQRGRTIGFPTANIALGRHLEPARGVYAVRVNAPDGSLGPVHGVANIGRRPTVGGTESRLEVHLFDWSGDLYGRELEVTLVSYLRAEHRFAGLDELKAQIGKDAAVARALLG